MSFPPLAPTAFDTTAPRTALIIVDVQPDFCPGGPLATACGDQVATEIASALSAPHPYSAVVTTQDWHIDPGEHFSPTPDFNTSWPIHCVASTPGAELHPALNTVNDVIDARFHKGEYAAAYSGFEGHLAAEEGHDNTIGLAQWLRDHDITHVDVCGIATDFCVKATAKDAAAAGFHTRVLLNLTSAVSQDAIDDVVRDLHAAAVTTVGTVPTAP